MNSYIKTKKSLIGLSVLAALYGVLWVGLNVNQLFCVHAW